MLTPKIPPAVIKASEIQISTPVAIVVVRMVLRKARTIPDRICTIAITYYTYLKLTYSYNSDQDFVEQFKHQFYNLRYAYEQDDKVANYYMQLGEGYDKAEDSFSEEPIELDTTLEAPEDKPSMQNLKEKIQAYAISKKAYKIANKKD